jgi:hypothetical protein
MAHLIKFHCTHCGAQAERTIAQVAVTDMCENCGANTLVLTIATPPEIIAAGVPGEPLASWKARYFGSQAPVRGPAPPKRPAPGMPRPIGPAPAARRPMPVARKGNHAALFAVIGCVACVVLAVIVFAVAMSMTSTPTQPRPENAAPAPQPIATQPKSSSNAEAAVKQFRADTEQLLTELAQAEAAILKAESELASALESEKQLLAAQKTAADNETTTTPEERETAENAESDARKKLETKETELRQLRNGQSPLIGFVGAYEELVTLFAECDALVLAVNDKRALVQEARSNLAQVENEKLDLEIAAETADSAAERATAKLALNETDARIQKRRSDAADAQDEFADSQRGLSRTEADIEKLQEEAVTLRAKLDASDLATMQVLDALKAYEKALIEKGKAITSLKARQKELDDIMRSTNSPYTDYADAKRAYFEKRKARLACDREVSILEQNYLNNGGGAAAKEAIRRAKEVAADAKAAEKDARDLMNSAKTVVDAEEKSEKKLVKDIKTARDAVATHATLVAAEQEKVEKAMAKARVAAGPDEEKRIKRVNEVADAVKALRETHEKALTALQEVDKNMTRLSEIARAASAKIRELEKVLSYLKTAEISGLASGLVKELETMRLNKTLSFTDGDNLAKLSGDFRMVADDGALTAIAPPSVRGTHAKIIGDWSQSVRTADSCALRLASAGSALSLDLLR